MLDKTYKAGIELLSDQQVIRDKIRNQSNNICKDLLKTHCLCLGITKSIYSSHIGTPGKTNSSISARLPLIASFIQGIDVCEICIMEGLYTQAAVMLKQELETVAAVNECMNGKRSDRRTPNVHFTKFDLNREYGYLNGIGHVSDSEIFEALHKAIADPKVEDQHPISIVPQFDGDLCLYFYAMHILLIVQMIEQLSDLYSEMYDYKMPDEFKQGIEITLEILVRYKLLVEGQESIN